MDVLLLFFLYGMKFLVTVTKTKNWFWECVLALQWSCILNAGTVTVLLNWTFFLSASY